MIETIKNFFGSTGVAQMGGDWWKTLIMYAIVCVLMYFAIVKKYEPLLLVPIAFGMLLANLPGANLFHPEFFLTDQALNISQVFQSGGLVDILYLGVKVGVYPSLIFIGIGAMTDFSSLIARPSSLLIGAAAQFGVFVAFIGAMLLGTVPAIGFDAAMSAAIADRKSVV